MQHPNIVYILADDWGYGDISCLNAESKIPTPYTDAIAERGMTFTDAHSNSAVCTPTRYGVLTGRYCWRGQLKRGVLGGYDPLLIEDGRMTVPSLLQQAGYRTACIGKWHLGLDWHRNGERQPRPWPDGNDITVDFHKPTTGGPHTVGFDYSLIIPASLDIAPYCYLENGQVIEPNMRQTAGHDFPGYWRKGNNSIGVEHETCLLEFTRRSEQFIADHCREKPDQPFFLYVPLPSPHTPHLPRRPFEGMSECGVYGDFVCEHDWSIGQIVNALKRAGVEDDTLLIITSDNGADERGPMFDYEKRFGHRANYIFRGQKSDAWDGGHHIPFFAIWPDVIEPGSTCQTTVCLTDLMATAAEITGQTLPEHAGEDSVSMMPLWKGDTANYSRPPVIHHSISGQFAIRQGPWKLVDCRGSGGWSLSEKDVSEDAPDQQLYHLVDDPGEQMNLIHDQPEIADSLTAELRRMQQDQDEPVAVE